MHAVCDNLAGHVSPIGGSGNRTRLAMMQPRHRVEQVGHVTRSRLEGSGSRLIIGAHMRKRNANTPRNLANELQVARFLRRHINQLDLPLRRLLPTFELPHRRAAHVRRVLRADFPRRDERTLHVDADDRGLVVSTGMLGNRRHDGNQTLLGKRHRRRE